jgi:hypothetical protein
MMERNGPEAVPEPRLSRLMLVLRDPRSRRIAFVTVESHGCPFRGGDAVKLTPCNIDAPGLIAHLGRKNARQNYYCTEIHSFYAQQTAL